MDPVQRRDFLKNMGGIAASAAVLGTTMAPMAKAAGFNKKDDDDHDGCYDNDHSCQYQSCFYDQICCEQVDLSCFFEINCQVDQNNCCWFTVECNGRCQSYRKNCNDHHKRKHHWRCRECKFQGSCNYGQNCQIPCKLYFQCYDDDGCGYTPHCYNFNVCCWVDSNGCCCYDIVWNNCSTN